MDARLDQSGPGADAGAADVAALPPGADGPAHLPLARAWVLRTTPVTGRLEALASNGSLLVAAGADKIIISSDGVSWRLPRAPLPGSQVAFGANLFVAAGTSSACTRRSPGPRSARR
jgi:hypothetical protein